MRMSKTTKMMMLRGDVIPESRFRDRRGREHYDDGRFAPTRSEYIPPYYHDRGEAHDEHHDDGVTWDGSGRFRTEYDTVDGRRRTIGFGGPEMRVETPWPADEMSHKTGSTERGHSASDVVPPMTRERIDAWMKKLQNEDGTTGPHWSYEQAENLIKQKGYSFDPLEFYAALNIMYSDYCKVAKKMNVNTVDFFASMAEAFLADRDAVKNKLAAYYSHVVK